MKAIILVAMLISVFSAQASSLVSCTFPENGSVLESIKVSFVNQGVYEGFKVEVEVQGTFNQAVYFCAATEETAMYVKWENELHLSHCIQMSNDSEGDASSSFPEELLSAQFLDQKVKVFGDLESSANNCVWAQ